MPDITTLLSLFLQQLYAGAIGGAGSLVSTVTITGPGAGVALTNPSSTLLNVNGAITSAGTINAGSFFATDTGAFLWSTRTAFLAPADGQLTVTNRATTVGVGLDVLTDGTLGVRTRALADTAIVNASRFSSGANQGVVTFGPAAVVSITVKGGLVTAIS